jgi:tetratricopeptide (TPR) repeat protein
LAKKSLALLETHRTKPDATAYTLWILSFIYQQLGESSTAEHYARKSLEYSRRGKNPFLAARSLLALSHTLRKRDAASAEDYLKDAIRYFREADDKWGLGLALRDLGELLAQQKRWAEAKVAQEEGIRVYQFFGQTLNLAELLTEYGMTLCAEGHYQAALELHEQSLAIYRDHPTLETFYPLEHLGETNLTLGERRKALEYFLEAFSFAFSFDDGHTLAILVGMAEAFSHLAEIEKAVVLGSFALTRADPDLRERTTLLLKRLEPNLPAPDLHALRERVAVWQWADVATFVGSLQV